MNYTELKKNFQKEMNDFPLFYAYSDKQFNEGLAKLGVKEEELCKVGNACFMKKENYEKFENLITEHIEKKRELIFTDSNFAYGAFLYELQNNEYCITCDVTDSLTALDVTLEEIQGNIETLKVFKRAKDKASQCF